MKHFLQIHNTDCNKRTIFRTFLQWENARRGKVSKVYLSLCYLCLDKEKSACAEGKKVN